jgi:hypothetical protein
VRFGTARIAVIVALIAGGVAVLAFGFSSKGTAFPKAAGSSPSHSPTPPAHHSHSPTPTPSPQTTGVPIAVFNATATQGLGGQAQSTLQKAGYVPVQPAKNSPIRPISKTVVYYRGGAKAAQNKSNAEYMASKYFPGASVSELGPEVANLAKGAELVIVLGNDYATGSANT